jgi:hypothetical protein
VTPKSIGTACYFLILMSVILLVLTLVASQNINLLHLSSANELAFNTQVALSLLNSLITIASAAAILSGNPRGRSVWHVWAVLYFFVNAWQLANLTYLVPSGAVVLIMIFLLYSKPAQKYFDEQTKLRGRPTSRRVDHTYNIFSE